MKNVIKKFFESLGNDIRKKERVEVKVCTRKAEGIPEWLRQSDEAGIGVNDYICS